MQTSHLNNEGKDMQCMKNWEIYRWSESCIQVRKVSDNGGYEVESHAASHDITMEVQDKLQKTIFRNADHDKVTQ